MAFIESKSKEDLAIERQGILSDKTKPLADRKKAHKEIMNELMNPKKNFDPATFEPFDDDPDIDVKRRPRKSPPARLPTMGLLPKELLEGQMVGMYESKQDLYLVMAHYINDLLDRIEALEGDKGPNKKR